MWRAKQHSALLPSQPANHRKEFFVSWAQQWYPPTTVTQCPWPPTVMPWAIDYYTLAPTVMPWARLAPTIMPWAIDYYTLAPTIMPWARLAPTIMPWAIDYHAVGHRRSGRGCHIDAACGRTRQGLIHVHKVLTSIGTCRCGNVPSGGGLSHAASDRCRHGAEKAEALL